MTKDLHEQNDPVPVEIRDLAELAELKSQGHVPVGLKWERLSDEAFERLIFSLISSEQGYENPQWLMKTEAADRGRDLSVIRVVSDPLTGTTRDRVIIQCRHWRDRSISVKDFATLKEQVHLWEPPRVNVLIIVTTGRFSSDAVRAVEAHNESDTALRIEMWPESHLDRLLAARPGLIAEFNLR